MLEEERWVTCPKNEGHRLKLKHLNRHLRHLPQQSTPQPPPQQSTPQPPQQSSELSHSGNGTLTGSSRRNFF
jgi:hypothetical protein